MRCSEAVQFWAAFYSEINRETKYFEALVKLFDLYLGAGRLKEACDSLDRLVDIDPYDYRNHERISRLEGKADPVFLQNILARAAKAATVSTRTDGFTGAGTDQGTGAIPVTEEARAQQALEDLSVQVEIFLQYSLQSKAVERLQRIAELFPGEEEKNERLRSLYDRANWWPKGAPPKPAPKPAPTAPTPLVIHMPSYPSPPPAAVNPSAPAETHRDLAAIAEINRLMYRQSTPREVLTSTATETGKHLGVSRCLVTIGGSSESHLTAEYAAAGFQTAGAQRINALADVISKMSPDALGGIELNASTSPLLQDLGLTSALGVVLTDKETQLPAGSLIVGTSQMRRWKSNESFFLQAVGDQLVLSVNHTRLRSLVRSLAVADERTGLLSRGAYVDCLLMESNRARSQGTPLSLIVLHVDRGGDLLRQHGDAAVDHFIEQLARAVSSAVRQTDVAVKYTAWSLVFILPDTNFENAKALAEKLGKIPVEVNDAAGFISNRVLMPLINEAIYAVQEGVATPQAIDTIFREGMAHPMGPLTLADFIGLDVCLDIMRVLADGLGNPRYNPCPLLVRMVDAGWLGRKSGRGFYTY